MTVLVFTSSCVRKPLLYAVVRHAEIGVFTFLRFSVGLVVQAYVFSIWSVIALVSAITLVW
jgi:hypothetical protein